MLTGAYLIVALSAASLFGIVAWLASVGHSVRVQRTALVGAALTAAGLLAPSPWALLSLVAAVVAALRPGAVTHLAAAGATAVAFAGVLFLSGAEAEARRASRSYAGSGMDRAYISSLKSDLRNTESMIEVYLAEAGRYDAALLAPRREFAPTTANQIVLAPGIDRWHAWAYNPMADKLCDIGTDQPPTCPVTLPIDSAGADTLRIFTPGWVRDSLPADHWGRRLHTLRPEALRSDSAYYAEEYRVTVTDSGWVVERDLVGWRCLTGARKLAPAGVAPGGFVCHLLPVTWGGGADPHAH
jgi:hypothetical protein